MEEEGREVKVVTCVGKVTFFLGCSGVTRIEEAVDNEWRGLVNPPPPKALALRMKYFTVDGRRS